MSKILSERIKEAVEAAEKKYSVQQIASMCGVSVQSVYGWRSGQTTRLKGETLVELAEVSGYNARWIIAEKGKKFGISMEERMILESLPLLSPDMRENWFDWAKKLTERNREETNKAA